MTSKKSSSDQDKDVFSPIFSQCTQDESDNVDVVWNWNSPQSKVQVTRRKRLNVTQSPKLVIKRHSSNNNINALERLKVELETLRDEISSESQAEVTSNKPNVCISNIPDIGSAFDDSMEEHLLICSQEIEQELLSNQSEAGSANRTVTQVACDQTVTQISDKPHEPDKELADDSFDQIFENFTYTESKKETENASVLEEKDESPIKCSPEEIEQKRLQALAKLQAKKQEVIERNRLEALKRLELTKKKRALRMRQK